MFILNPTTLVFPSESTSFIELGLLDDLPLLEDPQLFPFPLIDLGMEDLPPLLDAPIQIGLLNPPLPVPMEPGEVLMD